MTLCELFSFGISQLSCFPLANGGLCVCYYLMVLGEASIIHDFEKGNGGHLVPSHMHKGLCKFQYCRGVTWNHQSIILISVQPSVIVKKGWLSFRQLVQLQSYITILTK